MKTSVLKFCVVIFGLFHFSNSTVFAQKEAENFTAKNAIYLELGGSSGIYAVNYSRIFHQKGKLKLNASAGFSMWPNTIINSKAYWYPAIPLEVSAFYGKSNHHLELGVGVIPHLTRDLVLEVTSNSSKNIFVLGALVPLRVGYRYQKLEGGFFFRIGYTPFFNVPIGGREDWVFTPVFAGLSIGKSF